MERQSQVQPPYCIRADWMRSQGHPQQFRRQETAALSEWLDEKRALNTPRTLSCTRDKRKPKSTGVAFVAHVEHSHTALAYVSHTETQSNQKRVIPCFRPKIHMVSKASIRVRPRPNHSLKVLDTGFSSSWPQANFR